MLHHHGAKVNLADVTWIRNLLACHRHIDSVTYIIECSSCPSLLSGSGSPTCNVCTQYPSLFVAKRIFFTFPTKLFLTCSRCCPASLSPYRYLQSLSGSRRFSYNYHSLHSCLLSILFLIVNQGEWLATHSFNFWAFFRKIWSNPRCVTLKKYTVGYSVCHLLELEYTRKMPSDVTL